MEQHVLLSMLSALMAALWGWLSYRLKRLEQRIENIMIVQAECRTETKVKMSELERLWQRIDELQKTLEKHTHNGLGRYVP